jgi:hypothetical protein
MMPTVTISQSNFSRLQKASTPLVDDLDSVLAKILDVYEAGKPPADSSDTAVAEDMSVRSYPADNPPPLTYTTINSVKIDGADFGNRWWNPILFEVIARAAKKMGKDELKPFLDVNYKEGKHEKFQYIKDADISVQGRDSNLCWRSIMRVAKAAKIPLEVDFTWQDQPTAAFPGRIGRFVYDGK